MKIKTIVFASLILLFSSIIPQRSYAQEQAYGSSASLSSILSRTKVEDNRAEILQKFLQQFDSPLALHARVFVEQADLYQLDWRFVAAIAGRESTYGKAEPCINPFGYGVFGTQTLCFPTYDEGIRTVSKDLREKYMDKWGAQTIWQIGSMYAASPTWASGVISIMNQIQNFALSQPQPLPISL